MNQEQHQKATEMTVNDLAVLLTNESTTKNVLAIQLAEANQVIQNLKSRVAELEALLDDKTTPEKETNDD
ncbi:hypothetical protein [Streptococcus pluranimalium]|uniref:hypothetical protein n=1 Tax=Streptococcus pluranimalium TaxID=82348 RepID=UPI003F680931